MNNNSILIDRYLQNEMSAEERLAFEDQLATDKVLQQEMHLQQQIIKAATTAGLKAEFTKAIRKKIITKQLLQWGSVIGVVAIAAVLFFSLRNNKAAEEKIKQEQNKAVEKFEINNAADTIIETKDGVVFGIPANAFNTDGKTVQLEIKTALNAYDIINNGLSTTSNEALLQTAGMFYINGFVDGKAVPLAKDISVSVPADTVNPEMQLFDGVEDSSGNINWVNPKPVEKKLRTYDITTLDFYPPKYIPALKALGKAYQNKKYTDSLYYSFSGYPNQPSVREEVRGDSAVQIQKEGNDYLSADTGKLKKILDSLAKSKIAFDISTDFSPYQVDPSIIRAFWNKKFNNTFLATKEFEERLQYMHTLCTSFFLELYLNNLDKPLYKVDELCASSFNNMESNMSAAVRYKFIEFEQRKDGGVIIANGMQQKLSNYFQQKYKAYKDAAAKTWTKYQHTLDSLSTIADVKRRGQLIDDFTRTNNNFREEFCANVTDAYRQIGQAHDCNNNLRPPSSTQYYNTTISSTGWKNLDAYVYDATVKRQSMTYKDGLSGKTATITYTGVSFTIENAAQFDRVLVYLIPDSLTSFQRVAKEGNVFKEQLNGLFKYEAVVVAYKGTQAYFFKQENVQAKDYILSVFPVTDVALRKSLSTYSLSKSEALKKDVNYQLFEQQETIRLVQLQKDMEFREKIAAAIFTCGGKK
ncbi:anti-sigma factor family protein [Ferruginibacter sp. SUN106]|uniref:anti-sigma factor family protein n=1 Tax=Ferruginibacter sp. SUN106 TaxID=2978348 RepID=UPI003D36C371